MRAWMDAMDALFDGGSFAGRQPTTRARASCRVVSCRVVRIPVSRSFDVSDAYSIIHSLDGRAYTFLNSVQTRPPNRSRVVVVVVVVVERSRVYVS